MAFLHSQWPLEILRRSIPADQMPIHSLMMMTMFCWCCCWWSSSSGMGGRICRSALERPRHHSYVISNNTKVHPDHYDFKKCWRNGAHCCYSSSSRLIGPKVPYNSITQSNCLAGQPNSDFVTSWKITRTGVYAYRSIPTFSFVLWFLTVVGLLNASLQLGRVSRSFLAILTTDDLGMLGNSANWRGSWSHCS